MADLTPQLADQLDSHWRAQLRPRLDGLSDDEYFWQPVPGCWTVHPREAIHHGAEIACLRDLYAHSHNIDRED